MLIVDSETQDTLMEPDDTLDMMMMEGDFDDGYADTIFTMPPGSPDP